MGLYRDSIPLSPTKTSKQTLAPSQSVIIHHGYRQGVKILPKIGLEHLYMSSVDTWVF